MTFFASALTTIAFCLLLLSIVCGTVTSSLLSLYFRGAIRTGIGLLTVANPLRNSVDRRTSLQDRLCLAIVPYISGWIYYSIDSFSWRAATIFMMYLISKVLQYGAPFFIITSPVTSYADQIISINRNRSSAGFSLDIPLIMLIASIMKVFYWFGAYYDVSLLVQAVITIGIQIVLLKVALDNRPSPGIKSGIEHTPFSNLDAGELSRPYEFWQWKNARPYWMFLAYFAASLTFIHVLMSYSQTYIDLLGYVGLAIEATLPLPQIISNHSSRSCKGFRLSVVAAWVLGDTTKLSYFFFGGQFVPWAFRLCAMFQCVCDCYLGFQFYLYTPQVAGNPRNQESWGAEEKDIRMT